MSESIKDLRLKAGFSQVELAAKLGITHRTYIKYENDEKYAGSLKYKYIEQYLKDLTKVDETHGILTITDIQNACKDVFEKYNVEYCILFGSYAKGLATETSDIDMVISTDISGLRFYGLVEDLRTALQKKLDVLNIQQLSENQDLIHEVLKDGIKIYG